MPRTFQEKYPIEMHNLRQNSRKLTTPFDIHETLKHLLHFDTASSTRYQPFSRENGRKLPRGMSLLKNIPADRSCEDAQIEAHWCSCLNWISLNINSSNTRPLNETSDENWPINSYEPVAEEKKLNVFLKNNLFKLMVDIGGGGAKKNLSANSTLPSINLNELVNKVNFRDYIEIKASLKQYTKSALKIAYKAVEFMNSLIDKDLQMYCHKLYVHSIQKLSKLDINSRLLAFKESKDIHGREALFFNLNSDNATQSSDTGNLDEYLFRPTVVENTSTSITNFSNSTSSESPEAISSKYLDSETVFQISLTTWPSQATYELSLKYNRYKGLFSFNKNEISRINSYNGTSNCIVNKRPDLRQFCFCKFNF